MFKGLGDGRQPFQLVGHVQEYGWGKVGAESRIASFLGGGAPNRPLAEYWLGTHPKGPVSVLLNDGTAQTLSEVAPEYDVLPFMMKVLSINPMFGLSIQSHPDSLLAKELHARDPEHYPDPFHKPEVGVALTSVRLLYGVKSAAALQEAVTTYPELCELLSAPTRDALKGYTCSDNEFSESVQRGVFSDCISADSDSVCRVVTSILNRCLDVPGEDSTGELRLMSCLSRTYGKGDAGLIAILLMNLVSLKPGEAIFIGANIPHAYLEGDLVECMACSDNVIRAGLTNKFRDVKTLLETTICDERGVPQLVETRESLLHYTEYVVPTNEFRLGRVHSHCPNLSIDLSNGYAVVLSLGVQTVITWQDSAKGMTLSDGGAALLPRGLRGCHIATEDAEAFVVWGTKKGFEDAR